MTNTEIPPTVAELMSLAEAQLHAKLTQARIVGDDAQIAQLERWLASLAEGRATAEKNPEAIAEWERMIGARPMDGDALN